jgi:hypothetical protein
LAFRTFPESVVTDAKLSVVGRQVAVQYRLQGEKWLRTKILDPSSTSDFEIMWLFSNVGRDLQKALISLNEVELLVKRQEIRRVRDE